MTTGSNVELSYKGPCSPFDSDSDPHVDSVGILGHMNNVNLHLIYQYIHRWSSWEETEGGPSKSTYSSAMYYTDHK